MFILKQKSDYTEKKNSEMLKTAEMVSYEWHYSIHFHLDTFKLSRAQGHPTRI